jgi:glutamine synthetase
MLQHFTFLGHQDLSGIVRGRSVPKERAAEALSGGLPWVPANYTIGAMNTLPPDNPFGPMGEIRLMPDQAARLAVDGYDGRAPFDLYLCDARTPDGAPWPWCPRTALKDAVAALKAETGLTMRIAFEHEFTVRGLERKNHVAFSFSAGRIVSHLADRTLDVLDRAGIALEQFQAEYGMDQFEISSTPADPLRAADKAVLTLEAIRDCARQLGLHASFLPKPAMNEAGNGVHMHFSLWDGDRPATCEGDWLGARAGAFVSGLLAGAEGLIPFTCLSANSYARIRPNSWVGSYRCVGRRNREAMIRVVPRAPDAAGGHPRASIEYRVMDATANVYLAIAAVIRAGLEGLRSNAPTPESVDENPEGLEAAERERRGIVALPDAMADGLTPAAEALAARWLGPALSSAYYGCRRNDLRHAEETPFDELAARLSTVY